MATDGSALGYTELLRLAVAKGLQELDISVVQIPADTNHGYAVVLATARLASGTYRSLGEAWWDEAVPGGRSHALTLAESRAKVRALCDAVAMPQTVADPARRGDAEPVGAGPEVARPSVEARPAAAPMVQRNSNVTPAPALVRMEPAPQSADTGGARTGEEVLPERAVSTATPGHTADGEAEARAVPPRQATAARQVNRSSLSAAEGLGPDVLQKLMQMTRRISELKHEELTEEDALAKLDSFFVRAFSHPLAEGTRVEGQRVVQRLASDLARLQQDGSGEAAS